MIDNTLITLFLEFTSASNCSRVRTTSCLPSTLALKRAVHPYYNNNKNHKNDIFRMMIMTTNALIHDDDYCNDYGKFYNVIYSSSIISTA